MTQFAFKRTGDDDYPRHLKVLLQGPPKSGKTTFIATAPNVVVAACEAGLASIAHLDIPYVNVDGTDKLQNLEMILRDDTLRAHAAKQLGLPKIETVAIDTLDAWQEMLKKEVLAENKRSQMQQADWGTLKERMAAIMKKFVTLPVNVIFTVHTSTTQDDESRLVYAPALQGSIKDEIAGYVDFSLLSFRQRETNKQGVAKISYYLKCEGDQKNPHLGNRAAGRLPEIVEPSFKTLHDAVFGAIKRAPRVEAPVEEVAQSPSQLTAEADTARAALEQHADELAQRPAAATVEVPDKAPTGVPEDNPDAPINASGVTMLTRSYTEQGLIVPEDLTEWTIGKARTVAKYFIAWKTDKAANKDGATREDLISVLTAYEAFAGEIPGVQTGVDSIKSKPLDNPPADKPAKTPEPEVKSEDEQAEEAAVKLLQDQLGAVEIGHTAAPDAKCGKCGKPVNDPDIANLAVIKFKQPMCVDDYKLAVRAAKQ